MVNTVGTRIIESVIDGLSRGNNMGGMMRGLDPIQFVPLDRGAEERSTVV